jgi:hypothetical protein
MLVAPQQALHELDTGIAARLHRRSSAAHRQHHRTVPVINGRGVWHSYFYNNKTV